MRSPSLPIEDAKLTLSLGLAPLTLQIIALSKIRRFCDIMPREIKILSFGRAKGPQTLEVDVFKATPTTRLGLTLQPPEDETVAGVVIAHIDANAPLREAKKLLPGDIVTSVNCVPVASLSAVSAQIQQASGVLRFEVLRRPLPAGWRTKYVVVEGEIRIRYRNKKLGLWMLSHPHARHTHTKETMEGAVADSDSEDEAHGAEPPTPRSIGSARPMPHGGEGAACASPTDVASCAAAGVAFRTESI